MQLKKRVSYILITAASVFMMQIIQTPSVEAGTAATAANRYAVIINCGSEYRFWQDAELMYNALTKDCRLPADKVYLLNYRSTNPYGVNPNRMIYGQATKQNLEAVFNKLSGQLSKNDELIVFVTGHGRGYSGPVSGKYGYLDSRASVKQDGDQDYLEKDFKLMGFSVRNPENGNPIRIGMDKWAVVRDKNSRSYYRIKYVSHFNNLYFNGNIKNMKFESGIYSDNDIYIEMLVDFLEGDKNRDGMIEPELGESLDSDMDGKMPYDEKTGIFDEGDWGSPDYYVDNAGSLSTNVTGGKYVLFDRNLDNHLSIDLNYTSGLPRADGTDTDNDGLFEGLDVNGDGDRTDRVSIDEAICLPSGLLYHDEFASIINKIAPGVKTAVIMTNCHGGGFVRKLSSKNRVIITACEADNVSWNNTFARNLIGAVRGRDLNGKPVNADSDKNGRLSLLEVFNYAAKNDNMPEKPQYDDNGDGKSVTYPINCTGEGTLGIKMFLN